MTVSFELAGQRCVALNGGPVFQFILPCPPVPSHASRLVARDSLDFFAPSSSRSQGSSVHARKHRAHGQDHSFTT